MEEDDELDLFIEAQDTVWDDVLTELKAGRKTSHWMWFVFPQLASLGQSDMAQLYGIDGIEEATAYLAHPVLAGRLAEVSQLLLTHTDKSAAQILGDVDAKKLCSSMTLFSNVPSADPVFAQVLAQFCDAPCQKTLDEIAA